MPKSLSEILTSARFPAAAIAALDAQGYDTLYAFKALSRDGVLAITNTATTAPEAVVKPGWVDAALALVQIELAPVSAPAPVVPVAPPPAATPAPAAPQGPQQFMMVNKYDGGVAAMISILQVEPTDETAKARLLDLTRDQKTGKQRECFWAEDGVIDPAFSAELNNVLMTAGRTSLSIYKGRKGRTLDSVLKVRQKADPRDQTVLIVNGISTNDGVDWSGAEFAYYLPYARLFMPDQAKALAAIDGYTLADELKTATHPRYTAIKAQLLADKDEGNEVKAEQARALLWYKEPNEVAQQGDATFPGGKGKRGAADSGFYDRDR